MFDCNIILYCFCLDNMDMHIISKQRNSFEPLFYKVSTEDSSIEDSLYNLFSEYIIINPKYIKYNIFDIKKNENNINIYYSAILPIGTKVGDVFKISYNNLSDPLLQKALRYV